MISYSPAGDLTVVILSFLIAVLALDSYTSRTRSFRIFIMIIITLMSAALMDVLFHCLPFAWQNDAKNISGFLRCLYHTVLFSLFILFAVYICEVARFTEQKKKILLSIEIGLCGIIIVLDVLSTLFPKEFESMVFLKNQSIYVIGYTLSFAVIVIMLVAAQRKLYSKIVFSFFISMMLACIVLLIQGVYHKSSYTVVTFLFPVLVMFYSMHSGPYDAQLGSAPSTAFADYVKDMKQKQKAFVYISFYMPQFENEGFKMPEELQDEIREHSSQVFHKAILFRIERGHLILVASVDDNPNTQEKITKALQDFQGQYNRYQFSFKIITGQFCGETEDAAGFLKFLTTLRATLPENTIHYANDDDFKYYVRREYLRKILEDICTRQDINDERVLAYCQPVYDVKTDRYDTAEILMRLYVDGQVILPIEFISLAEEAKYIHILTKIILHKACCAVKKYVAANYDLKRVSVNISPFEIQDSHFVSDIVAIIEQSEVPRQKIALELTESQSDADFVAMKQCIEILKEYGVCFYLDDFGTGYSNMERILKIPFDIIKIDRSLVMTSRHDKRSHTMITKMSDIFASMNYDVLYEGVEDETDEAMCIAMSATYLQGYKYSTPIPIANLEKYLVKINTNKEA